MTRGHQSSSAHGRCWLLLHPLFAPWPLHPPRLARSPPPRTTLPPTRLVNLTSRAGHAHHLVTPIGRQCREANSHRRQRARRRDTRNRRRGRGLRHRLRLARRQPPLPLQVLAPPPQRPPCRPQEPPRAARPPAQARRIHHPPGPCRHPGRPRPGREDLLGKAQAERGRDPCKAPACDGGGVRAYHPPYTAQYVCPTSTIRCRGLFVICNPTTFATDTTPEKRPSIPPMTCFPGMSLSSSVFCNHVIDIPWQDATRVGHHASCCKSLDFAL